MNKLTAEQIISRRDCLKSDRATWESHWQEIADYVMPYKSSITKTQQPGKRRNDDITDDTAIQDNDKLASGVFGFLCPPKEQWFQFQSTDPKLNEVEEVNFYFGEVSRRLMQNMYISNFALEMHEDFLDLGAFGTSNIYVEPGRDKPFRFKNIPIESYVIDENAYGEIDTVYFTMKMTPRQMLQRWDKSKLSKDVQAVVEKGGKDMDKKYNIVHAVQPRTDITKGKVTRDNLPIMSMYIDEKAKHIIDEGGYEEMPYVVGRFMKAPDEIYGRSPGVSALPRIKMINRMGYTIIRNSEKIVDPPILMPDDGVVNDPNMNPGAIMYLRSSYYENKPVPFETRANIPIGLEMMQREEIAIHKAFYTELFDTLADRKNMTATEVIERVERKLLLFVPIMARIQAEKITPLLHRCFGILSRIPGALPPLPQILQENPGYDIQYVGKMALALKSLDVAAIADTMMLIQPYAELNPEILRNFDFNAIARGVGLRKGVPQEFIVPQEVLDAENEAAAKKAEAQEQMAMMTQGADIISKTQKETEPNSPLANIGEAMTQQ